MKKKPNNNLSEIYEESAKMARWIALYEAINCCADKAEQKNIPFSKVNLKPLDIKDYISSTEDIILKKILKCDYNIDVCYDDTQDKDQVYQY
jgi:hypothetical protein